MGLHTPQEETGPTRAGELEPVLAAERLVNSQQIARVRFWAIVSVLALSEAFRAMARDFVGAPRPVMLAYGFGAGVILLARRRATQTSRIDGLVIPCIDMPVLFVLLSLSIRRLHEVGAHADASGVPLQGSVFFALFIFLAALSLEAWQIYVAAAVAIVLQGALILLESPNLIYVVSQVSIGLGFATALAAYARRRTVRLAAAVASEQRRRERLGRYFSPQVAAHLEEHAEEFGRAESREVTVLFADLRDFTALADQLDGPAVVATLNAFHSRMVEQLFAFDGTLDKYMGDGIMAYFGAPVARADHAEQAVRCALAMQAALAQLNRDRTRRGAPPLRMGVGIHTGRVVLGDIGAPRRREYTAVGDTVNLAARIEQLTKIHGTPVLVSEETRRQVSATIAFTPAEPMPVKGKPEPIRTYAPRPLSPSAGGT